MHYYYRNELRECHVYVCVGNYYNGLITQCLQCLVIVIGFSLLHLHFNYQVGIMLRCKRKQISIGTKPCAILLVKAIFVSLFFWICQNSYAKFQTKRKSSATRIIEVEELQYPSISICVENSLKEYVDISGLDREA